MALKLWARLAIAAVLLLTVAHPIDLESCGPFIPAAVFVRPAIPEGQAAFFKGQLGVLQPTYWRRYLVVAYRTMSGLPPSDAPPADQPAASSALDRWQAARQKVSATPTPIDPDRAGADFSIYRNCNDDAFESAIATLQDRIRVAGAASPEVKDWLAAQDQVFSNCASGAKIPTPAPAGSTARIRTDRAYQIAAAHFYAGDYEDAKTRFQQIARDPDSPWRTIAPYLAARSDVRKGAFPAAQAELAQILADPKLVTLHSKAAALLGLVHARIDPSASLIEVSKRLRSPDSATLEQDLESFTFLYDKLAPVKDPKDDLIAWIETMQGRGAEAQAIEHWQKDHATPWLVAAITHASKATPDLIAAGLAVPANSPAWATAHYHAIRLLIDTNQIADARKALADAAPHFPSLNRSSQNAFAAQTMTTAATLDTFLTAAIRFPSGTVSDTDVEELTKDQISLRLLGADAAAAFNLELPLNTWLQIVKQTKVPAALRKHIAQTGFVRALLLKNSLAPDFAQIVAQLSPPDAARMRRFIAATKPDDRFHEGIFWLLHRPGVSNNVRGGLLRSEKDQEIDSYRDNWWPPRKDAAPPLLSFLTPEQKKQGEAEAKQLNEQGSARAILATTVLAWAQAAPDDPRLPEALATTIRMSHYSPEDSTADQNIEKAFNTLHQRFPQTTWAKQTPYWYK